MVSKTSIWFLLRNNTCDKTEQYNLVAWTSIHENMHSDDTSISHSETYIKKRNIYLTVSIKFSRHYFKLIIRAPL